MFFLQENFNIPNTDGMRRKVLSIMATRWRDFKTYLTREYINEAKKDEDPCFKYGISEEDWRQFNASRLEDFWKVSNLISNSWITYKYSYDIW